RSYNEGEYPQKLAEAQRNLEMAKITLRKQEQNLAQTRNLLERGYVTSTDMEKAQLDRVTAQNDFEKKTTELRVLTDYTHEKEEADKQNKVAQAEKKVARTNSENASNLAQKIADEQTKEQSLLIQRATLDHWHQEEESCTLRAPSEGMVVYGSSVNTMFYRESPIQAGAKIMQQQLLARLPDTSTMKVVARIAESNAAKLRIDKDNWMRATVKIQSTGEVVPATVTSVSVLPDNTMRWMNPDLKEYPVDVTLDRTPAGLKPGASATVEILVQHLDDVLTAPLGAIYSLGTDQYAFVRDGSRVKPVKLTLGATNDTVAQIKDGLQLGDEVLVLQLGQGQKLLEAAGIKSSPGGPASDKSPATQPTVPGDRVAETPTAPQRS
ncbi:MAG: HlyD family efflux transporter periplasmic adaptor subunit, partial [Anaerolineae bacterium]|nr:HlyD family efflux transporter periplasmic adaptor subunit [Phycisphaerae bacterium]